MTKRILCLLLTLLLLPLSGCALFQTTVEDMDEADATPYYTMGEGFLTALFAEDYAGCFALFSEDLQNQLSQTELQDAWENVRLTYGDPASVASRKPYWINGEGTVVYQVACAHGGCSVQLTYDADNNVAGLWFGLAEEDFPYEVAVPEGVVEYEITLGEGTDTPLKALVTRARRRAHPRLRRQRPQRGHRRLLPLCGHRPRPGPARHRLHPLRQAHLYLRQHL